MKTMKFLFVLCGSIFISFSSCQQSVDVKQTESELTAAKKSAAVNQLLSDVRDATDIYHDVSEAEAAGYVLATPCISNPQGPGAMGVHYIKFPIDGTFDPLEPEALVYEIKNNGDLKLVAVEYLYVGSSAPMFAGEISFNPTPVPIADYALHAWIWKGNPDGIFQDFNVNVTCP